MNSLSQFTASNTGRVLRAVLGIALVYFAVLGTHGPAQIVLAVIALILFFGALFDMCGLGLFTHGSARGSDIRRKSDSATTRQTTIALLVIGIIAFFALGLLWKNTAENTVQEAADPSTSNTLSQSKDIDTTTAKQHTQNQNDMLLYLIEEEKLAHDIYTSMYQLYGERVFGNILQSEKTHQGKVLALLRERNIADPRSSQAGVFNNSELQKLYDDLISQGQQSEIEAYKVGVAIEEKDIADITKQLASATEQDIIDTLEALRNGSENHLRAFNRQL